MIFEGLNEPELQVHPTPVVSQCALITEPGDWARLPNGLNSDALRWVFREDSFDPVTRVRRGRVYQPHGSSQPASVTVLRNPSPDYLGAERHHSSHRSLQLFRYIACTELRALPGHGLGQILAIGSGGVSSAWKIVQVETLVNEDMLVTLKARTAFGVLPDLDEAKLPEASRQPVRQALDRAVNSAFRETAVSVVDQCRNAMAMVLSHYLLTQGEPANVIGKELAPLGELLKAKSMDVCASAALIVARMHARGKGNVQQTMGVREPVDEDGELAVHALGLVLREVGWAV